MLLFEVYGKTEEINSVGEANLGLGCGNPTAIGEIKKDIVLDLGAEFDCFLAAQKTGVNLKAGCKILSQAEKQKTSFYVSKIFDIIISKKLTNIFQGGENNAKTKNRTKAIY